MEDSICWEIRDFVEQYIRTVSDLELLLQLESHENRRWTVLDVSREMRTNPTFAQTQLQEFCRYGIVDRVDGDFYVFTRDSKKRALTASLRTLYNQKRLTVIAMIYGRPLERVRGFADAFKIKKEK